LVLNKISADTDTSLSTPTRISNPERADWIWAIFVSCLAILLANVPYLLGFLFPQDNFVFAGITVAPGDNLSYLSAIRQGMQGNWLYQIPYTAYEHKGVPAYTYYLALGHLSRLLRLNPLGMLHLARTAGNLLLLVTLFHFLRYYFETRIWRRYAFLIGVFSSGIGWLLLPVDGYLSMDLTVPEANTFFTLMGNAHFPIALVCLLVFWSSLINVEDQMKRSLITGRVLAFISAGILANLQPFILALALIIALTSLVISRARTRAFPRERIIRIMAAGSVGVPVAAFLSLGMMQDPLGKEWLSQNLNLTPHIGFVISAYGFLWIPTIVGVISMAGKRSFRTLLLLTWLMITMLGLYAPVDFQRRLSLGLHIAISVSATVGLRRILERCTNRVGIRVRLISLLAVVPTNVTLVILYSAGILTHSPQLYLTQGEYEALQWLDSSVDEVSVILSSTELATFIPAFSDHRAVSGNAFATPNAEETEARVHYFFSEQASEVERRQMLQVWGVDYLLIGQRERAYGFESLGLAGCTHEIGPFRDVSIYEIKCSFD